MIMVGSNLTDLGRNQLGYDDNATRLAIAQAQARAQAQAVQAQQQQLSQERFFRSQQQAQENAIQRQQLAQNDFFNRGRLTNQAQANVASTAAAEAERFWQSNENDKNRANQLAISSARRVPDMQDMNDMNAQSMQLSDAVNNFAQLLNQKEELSTTTSKVEGARVEDAVPSFWKSGFEYWTRPNRKDDKDIAAMVPNYPGAPTALKDRIAGADTFFKKQIQDLDVLIQGGLQSGLAQHVAKGPDGKWRGTIAAPSAPVVTPAPQAAPFFNAPAPAMTNAPVVPVAPPMTNAPAFNSGGMMPPAPPVGAIVRQNGVAYRFDGANYIPVQ